MFHIRPTCTSDETLIGARLVLDMHGAGMELHKAIRQLEPIIKSVWERIRALPANELNGRFIGGVVIDPEIVVNCNHVGQLNLMHWIFVTIQRPGMFKIMLECSVDGSGSLLDFTNVCPSIGIEATDFHELICFLAKANLYNGELHVPGERPFPISIATQRVTEAGRGRQQIAGRNWGVTYCPAEKR